MDQYSRQEAQRRVGRMFDVMETLMREKPSAMVPAAVETAKAMRVIEEATQAMALMTPGAKIVREGE